MKDIRPAPTSSWRTHLLIILLLFILAPVNLISIFPHITTHIPGDVMDTAEYPLNEWWTAHALVDLKSNPYINHYMFYPLGQNLVQHTYNFLDGLFYTVLRPFVSLIVFHNLIILMTSFANALAAYCLIFYVTQIPWPAFLGALAFGHSPTLLSYFKTVNLLEVYNFVFFVLFSYGFVRQGRLKWAVPAGIFWGLSLYNYPYYFIFGGLWLLLLIVLYVCPWEIQVKTQPEVRVPLWIRGFVWLSLIGLLVIPVVAPRRLWEFLVRVHLVNWPTFMALGLIMTGIWTRVKYQALIKTRPGERDLEIPAGKKGRWVDFRSAFQIIIKSLPIRWNPLPFRNLFLLFGLVGISLVIAVLIGFPYFYSYFKEEALRRAVKSHPVEFSLYSVDLISFFAPFNVWLDGLYKKIALNWISGRPIVGTPAFLGYGFMGCLLWGIGKFFKRAELRLWLIAWGVFILISLGPALKVHGLLVDSLPLPAFLIRYIPVWESARTLSRYLAPSILFLCLLVVLILKPYYLSLSSNGKKVFLSVLLLMIGLEYGLLPYPYSLGYSDYRIPKVYQVLDQRTKGQEGVLLDLPLFIHSGNHSAGYGETRRFYYQTTHKQKLIGGVSSKLDETVFSYFQKQPALAKLWSLQPFDENELAALIYAYDIKWIVLDKRYYPLEMLRTYRSLLEPAPYIKIFFEDSRYLGYSIDQTSTRLKERALQYWGKPKALLSLLYPDSSGSYEFNPTQPLEMIVPSKFWNILEIEFSPEAFRAFYRLKLSIFGKKEINLPFSTFKAAEGQRPFIFRPGRVFSWASVGAPPVKLIIIPGGRRQESELKEFPFKISLFSQGQLSGFDLTPKSNPD
jgi:hypothetical protein